MTTELGDDETSYRNKQARQRALREIRKLALKQEGEVTELLRTTEKEPRP
jgi:hypothetical protein